MDMGSTMHGYGGLPRAMESTIGMGSTIGLEFTTVTKILLLLY